MKKKNISNELLKNVCGEWPEHERWKEMWANKNGLFPLQIIITITTKRSWNWNGAFPTFIYIFPFGGKHFCVEYLYYRNERERQRIFQIVTIKVALFVLSHIVASPLCPGKWWLHDRRRLTFMHFYTNARSLFRAVSHLQVSHVNVQ